MAGFSLDDPSTTISAVTIKRVSAGGGKIVERKLERAISDSHEAVTKLIAHSVQEFIDLDTKVATHNKEATE